MTDLATITKRAHDTGFEQGSHITLQTVMAWLDAHGGPRFAESISLASASGDLARFRPERCAQTAELVFADPVGPTDLGPPPRPKLTRDEAKSSGYTGDVCGNDQCQQMTVRRNGSCTVCDACGQTTGCS